MTNTIIFFLALCFTFYFLGKLATWMVYKIAPQNCKREFGGKDIFITNTVMLMGIILWTILFHNLTH